MYIYFFCIFIFVYLFIHCFGRSCEILHISPYSVRMRENTDQKKLRIWTLFTQCFSELHDFCEKFIFAQSWVHFAILLIFFP